MKRLLLLVAVWLLICTHQASACPTTQVTFWQYVSRSVPIQEPLRPAQYRFEEIKAAAHRYVPALIYDSARHVNELYFLIWHTAEQPYAGGLTTNWAMDVYIRSSDVLGADPNSDPMLIATAVILPIRDDETSRWSAGGTAFLDFDPNFLCSSPGVCGWASGARSVKFRVTFYPLVDLANDIPVPLIPSFVQNGTLNGCVGASDQDYDGDGSYDVAVWNKRTGEWSIKNSGTIVPTVTRLTWGRRGDIPFAADFTADHRADFVVFRPSNMTFYVCRSETQFDCNQSVGVQLGMPGDEPLKGDFNDDGVYDLAVQSKRTGVITWWNMTTSRLYSTSSGDTNGGPVR